MAHVWIDVAALGLAFVVGGMQYLRGIRGLSVVVYETVALAGVLVLATALFLPLREVSRIPAPTCFLLLFVGCALLGILVATSLSRRHEFGFGGLDYALAVVPAGLTALIVVRAFLQFLHILGSPAGSALGVVLQRSWLAQLLLYAVALRPVLRP